MSLVFDCGESSYVDCVIRRLLYTMGESQQNFSALNFDKLNLDNFHTWKFSMKMFLIGKGLWEIVDGSETVAEGAGTDALAKFKKRDNLALSTICLGINSDLHIYVRASKSGKDAWDALSKRFEEKTLSKKISYRRKLYRTNMNPGTDMTTHINHIKTISEHLEALDDPVPEKDLVMILISSWPPEYNNLITTLETLEEEKLEWTYVRDRAIAEYERIKRKRDDHVNSKDEALNINFPNRGRGRGRGRGRKQNGQEKSEKRTCHRCKEVGHIVKNCPKKDQPKDRENGDANANIVIVDDDGEYALMSNINENQFDDADDEPDTDTDVDIAVINGYDPLINKDTEDTSSECIDGSDDSGDESDTSPRCSSISDVADLNADDVEYALTVASDKGAPHPSECCDNNPWLLDSGSSRHMTPSKDDFVTYLKLKIPVKVGLADDSSVLGYGIGNVNITLFDGNQFVSVVIKNVLYVPKLKRRLLSITDITEKGSIVTFGDGICTVKMKGKHFLLGQRHGKLWRVPCQEEQCFLSAAESFTASAKEISIELWHQRYGHLSYGNLDILNRKKMVNGLGDINSKNLPNDNCEGCILGKHNRSPFPKKSASSTTQPLDLIHSDVCGPMSVESIGGSRYFITFIDDNSRFVVTYSMKHKNEALDKFKEFVEMAETKFERRMKKVRTDNGGEYVSNAFNNYLKERGTQDQRTVPYTPEQNAVAERMNRTLLEKVRSMLHHSKLPLRFWAEALATATHLRNCSPTSTLDETPYERWNGEKPDVSSFRVFGCKAYAHIPKENRKKLDPKSQKCIFLGYPVGVKGYKLYDPSTRKMIVRRDVIFVENNFDNNIEKNGEPDELLPAICFDLDYDQSDDEDINDDVTREEEDRGNVGEQEAPREERPRRNVNPINRYGSIATHQDGHWEILGAPDEANLAIGVGVDDPKSYQDAMSSPNSDRWKTAADVEMNSILKNKTWELVDLPPGKTAIGSKWVFKTKMNADGSINKHKARLVAQGFAQQHGIDYEETFAPVVKYVSLRTVLAIANQHNMELHQMDVNSAYLNGDIDADIYMRQPEGFIDSDNPNKVCKLRKGLYGLKQGGRIWNQKIDHYLKSQGYTPSDADPCIYVKHNQGKIVIIALYVDDTIIASNCNEMLHDAKKMLNEKFDMTDLGEVKSILGMSVERNRAKGVLTINQSAYLQSALERFGMADCNPVSTPMEPGKHYEKTPDDEEGFNTREFQALIGSLVYASIATRPDISEAVGKLSQHMSRPNKEHWAAAKRVLRYIKGTLQFGLNFERSDNFKLIGYSDADWAGDVDTRKSTSGYVFMLGKATVAWASKKQSVVALSTTEAEYIALCSATQEAVWLRRLLQSLREGQARPTTIFEDNRGAISLSKNPKDHTRTKHIDIKYHYVRDAVQNNEIDIQPCETKLMIADQLTKGLPKPAFEKHRNAMNVEVY